MKPIVSILILCLMNFVLMAQKVYLEPVKTRIVKTINTNWTFNYFPDASAEKGDYENPAFDDSKWSEICIPHTWQTYETTQELHPYIRNAAANDHPYWWNGWGWYRKHLSISNEYQHKKIYIEFDGVQKYSKIFLNGKYLGDHKGGFTSFYMDATEAIKFGEDNVLTVAVNNTLKDRFSIPPMNAGNWVVYGGIFRDVRVVIKDKINVPYQGSYKHEGGTFITSPEVNQEQALVKVKTYVENNLKEKKNVRIVTFLASADKVIFDRIDAEKTLKPGEIAEFVQSSKPIRHPKLWSPETPYLYYAFTEVYDETRLVDTYQSTFGIRSVKWDFEAHRLVLNGKLTHLHGINRHEEYVWLGGAFPEWLAKKDMLDIAKGLEVNYMRTAHYPNAPYVYDFMDKNGILIDEELPNIKNQEFDPKVQEQNCREMIRRDRNHPSIILWSMGNETDHACDSRFAWEEDTTRILTCRQPYNESYNPKYCRHTDAEMPVESFLRCTIRGWYDKDDRNLEPEDSQWAGTEEWQHLKSNESVISEHNGTVWLYSDHGADREYVGAPLKHVNPKGWVDSWRTPKYVYYQWQANFAKTPMVFIHPHFWRSRYLGQAKDFIIDSNCDQVELFVNGKSKGVQKPAKSNNFNVVFKDIIVERGVIKAVATSSKGTKVTTKVVMASNPFALTIVPSHKTMMSSQDNIIEFKVDIVDKQGVHVYGANNTLKFDVKGPARLVGPDIYISNRDDNEQMEGTMYIDAPVTNLIRATGKPGKVSVTVSSPGLSPATTEITVIPYIDPLSVKGISEPRLSPVGRTGVPTNQSQVNFLKAPSAIKNYNKEIRFAIADQPRFRDLLNKLIQLENPAIDIQCIEYNYALNALVKILEATSKASGTWGYIVADDYNFIAAQFNIVKAITSHLNSKNLPKAYQKEMSRYYASVVISRGQDRNFIAEKEFVDQIPEGGRVVYIGENNENSGVAGMNETNLQTILFNLFPQSAAFSKDDLKKALQLICKINPYTSYKSVRDKKTKERTDSYTAEPGHVVLIPDFSRMGSATKQVEIPTGYILSVNGKVIEVAAFSQYFYSSFDFDGTAELTLKCPNHIKSCEISPLARKTKYQINEKQVTFHLEKPGYYVVRINDTDKIFVFAETPETKPSNILDITDFGVESKGQNIQTDLIQKAIDEAAKVRKTLYFPRGNYVAGLIQLRKNSSIHLARGAVLQADTSSVQQYSSLDQVKTRKFIYIKDADNVKISGYGIIDGKGGMLRTKFGDDARMRLIMAVNCKNLVIEGVTLLDPGSWNTQLLHCKDVEIRFVKLLNNTSLSNTDGFDPDASQRLLIESCFACCSDDNVAIKSTNYGDYLANAEGITIRGCVFLTKKSSLKVGTETRAKVMRNILFENNDVIECDRGMALYISDGTTFGNIRFVNNRFERNYPDAKRAGFYFEINRRNLDSKPGKMNNILIKDCIFQTRFPKPSVIKGLDKEHSIERITIDNLIIDGKKINSAPEAGIETNEFVKNLVVK